MQVKDENEVNLVIRVNRSAKMKEKHLKSLFRRIRSHLRTQIIHLYKQVDQLEHPISSAEVTAQAGQPYTLGLTPAGHRCTGNFFINVKHEFWA